MPLGPRSNLGRAIPVIDGGMVYVVKEHSPRQVLAIELATGKVAWTHDLGAAYEFANVGVARGAVYVGDATHGKQALVALDKRSGRPLWSAPMDDMPGPIVAGHDRVCTHTKHNKIVCLSADGHTKLLDYPLTGQVVQTEMVMTGASLYVAIDHALYALRFTGTPLAWKQTVQEGSLSAASLLDDGKELVVQTRTALRAFDATSGAPLWLVSSPPEDGAWSRDAKLPVELGGNVVGWSKSFVFGVTPEGRLAWQLAVDGSLSAAPITAGGDTIVLAVQGHKQELVGNTPRQLFN
jgi:outer membrane protein assembly factor BamB